MAAKQKNIFTRSKPLMKIYRGVDDEGKEVEVREDAEQLVKWHEISDALVAAGYYRAQLQGLSAFDKIVGGLTWCIELCDIDVDWLIKYSSEFREAKEDELRKFAVMQYDKNYIFESDRDKFVQREKLLRNLAAVQTDRYTKHEEINQNSGDTKIHYAVLHSELTVEVSKELELSEKIKYSQDVDKLTKSVDLLEKEVSTFKQDHEARMEDAKRQYTDVMGKLKKITYKLIKSNDYREAKMKSFITNTRLELAKLNREVMKYTVAVDEIPGTAELLQYEKRFMELYNQVASKHKETKQYYIFYNTLLEFESIVEWVNQTVKKVEDKFLHEKLQKTALYDEYSRLMDVQRQYAQALKKMAMEKQKIGTR
ncbi:Uncharacterized protein OBRU01_08329 [Operophtera brumata]|uniref:Coiled-coil domain-containing protein 93 n=1 Tax=Operophtera brumata TaxID=104452 RepID=A0A0L7LHM7_OPEBR|nr:Uncharacterized protein OBRU01_08329 [Operophtera brumata]